MFTHESATMDDSHNVSLRSRLGLATEAEVAEALAVKIETLRNWRSRRIGPPFMTGGKQPLYETADVLAWLRSKRHDTLDAA